MGGRWGILIYLTALLPSAITIPQQPPPPPERCKKALVRGPCTDWQDKWYFNQSLRACRTFRYGGCQGENLFDTEVECLHYCIGGDHTLPPKGEGVDVELIGVTPKIPLEERGTELTFLETGDHQVFTMAKSNAFIQLDGHRIKTFQLRLCREISFQFRTRLPHGLLVYHSIKNRPEGLNPYALYIIVEKGQLKVVHVFGKHSTSVIVGEGLNRDHWHSVTVTIDVHGARLIAKVGDQTQETSIQGLHPSRNYDVASDLESVVLIGGLSPEEKLHGVKYIIESFVGCIKDMVLSAGKAASDLLPIKPLIATKHDNVQEGCIDKCLTRENLCFEGSMCINHYNSLSCDCFGTCHEGEQCDIYTATILTLRGSSYVSYRVYDWKDRVHSSSNRISLHFKTRFDDSALFYASGESPAHHHIAVSLVNFTVVVDVDLGDGTAVANLGPIDENEWHNITLSHDGLLVTCYLNGDATNITLPGNLHHLYIDPEIYIGGGPELQKRKGLRSLNNFVGAMKYVFFNDVSILYELNKTNPKVHYIGVLEPEFSEVDVDVIPMTFAFPSSHFWWEVPDPSELSLSFDFKSSRSMAVLASAELGFNYWQLRQVNEEIRFEVTTDVTKNLSILTSVKFENREAWHTVELNFTKGEVSLVVDYMQKQANLFGINWDEGNRTIIGSTHIAKGTFGLVGCMRKVVISEVEVEPRYVVRSRHMVGTVSLDNCELVDPCKRPNACEHNGRCSVTENGLTCDCEDTGYIGKNCHFAKFRKTCEELALLGYTKPDVYLIDIDGNGRFPPAHVKCEFQSLEDSTKTIVEHNLPSQVDVRSLDDQDFSYTITYREFTREMLQELISHSLYCSQHIKYDCYRAPLDLHSATWFFSAANNGTVDYLGNSKRGTCPCAENRTCVNPDMSCNCDMVISGESKWHSDEGFYVSANSLGITQMVFLQQKDLEKDAIGRITLGPLECVETNTQKYVVTFTTSQSYIEVPGWRKGDIAFSFRTTGERAILLYQPPIRPHHPCFMVALTSDFQLTFNFTLNTGVSKELAVKSQRKLNSGEWQKIWIDYNKHHVRFMINTDYQMVDLQPEEEFGPFEGSMFIGGATEDMLVKGSVREGLIGCFRGLVVNGEILDIYSYMSVHLSEIIKDCKPSCDPNPCKNGARCKELWSSFQCVCENPWAYIGTYCQTNINENGMTLVNRESFYKRSFLHGDVNMDIQEKELFRGLLTEDLLLNLRTYDHHSLILHANDHLNNFVMLYITEGANIVFLFNSNHTIVNLTVNYPDLSSGKSVQIAIVRTPNETWLHVNDRNNSVATNPVLLTEYFQRPWENSSVREILAPQRPPSSPTEYFQVSVGGYDDSLLSLPTEPKLDGYVGCIRGLKIGPSVVDLTGYISAANKSDMVGLMAGCRMKCDEQPCKNQGVCIEDFLKGEASCDCEYTSYLGEMCAEEKGATFSGDSVLQRKFVLEGPIYHIKVQLAFSTFDERQRNTVVLLLQTEKKRNYYLLIGLSGEGDLIFMEDREGSAYGVRLRDRYFLNNARHSVYYKRNNDSAFLLIDRQEVLLTPKPVLSISDVSDAHPGSNEVQIGGLNSSDPRFAAYSSYTGCLSNVFLEVNEQVMKPLDEYMLFTKSQEDVIVKNAQGIRIAQCASFDEMQKPPPGPTLNISTKFGGAETKQWVEDPPARIPYKSSYSDKSTKEEGTGRVLFIIAVGIFVTVISGTLYHVYRSHVAYKKRKEAAAEAVLWRTTSQQLYQDKPLPPPAPVSHPPSTQLNTVKSIRSRSQDDATIKQNLSNDVKPAHKSSPATPAPTVRFRIPAEDHHPVRENGILTEVQDDDIKLKLLKPSPIEVKDVIVRSPSMDVVSCTINEDSAGEREEENEMERKVRPKSIDLGHLDKTDISEMDNLVRGSTTSIRSDASISRWKRLLSPIHFSENRRTFANPLSYFGGPKFFSKTSLKSKESILSVD